MRTPWGESQHIEVKEPGLYFVSTSSHGGFKVETPLLDKIPADWRRASFNGQGIGGWFEEDCDWSLVALTFPQHFTAGDLEAAQSTFDHYIRPKL